MKKNIFKVSCYDTKRHTSSHTDMYYLNKEDCECFLDYPDYHTGLIRIHLIQVEDTSDSYKMAKHNTDQAVKYDKIRDNIINNL